MPPLHSTPLLSIDDHHRHYHHYHAVITIIRIPSVAGMASSAFLTTATCCAILAATTLTTKTTTIAAAHPNPEAPPASSLSPSPPSLPSPTTSRAADRDHHYHHHPHDQYHRASTHARQAGRNFTGPPVSSRHGSRSLLFHFWSSPMDALFSKHSGRCGSGSNRGSSSGSSGSGGSKSGRGGGKGAVSELQYSSTADVQEEGPFVLEQVKNIRDLGSVGGSGIARGRVFRTGHLSDATKADATALRDVAGLRTLVTTIYGHYLERKGRSKA